MGSALLEPFPALEIMSVISANQIDEQREIGDIVQTDNSCKKEKEF
jgi:hypothetical protein